VAGTLLHITLAEKALATANLAPSIVEELLRDGDDYRLGSVLIDLPYYERLLLTGLKLFLGRDISYAKWGNRFHQQAPTSFCLSLLDQADCGSSRALALGALTHAAVDRVFHHEIHRRTLDAQPSSMSASAIHKQIEDEIDLHLLYDSLETSGIGTPYARQKLTLKPRSPWITMMRRASMRTIGEAPEPRRIERWRKELALFGITNSVSFVPWVKTLPRDDPELHRCARRLEKDAIQLSKKYLETGANYLDGNLDEPSFLEQIPQINLVDGSPG
jgi:Zinc dependent phospholipase C